VEDDLLLDAVLLEDDGDHLGYLEEVLLVAGFDDHFPQVPKQLLRALFPQVQRPLRQHLADWQVKPVFCLQLDDIQEYLHVIQVGLELGEGPGDLPDCIEGQLHRLLGLVVDPAYYFSQQLRKSTHILVFLSLEHLQAIGLLLVLVIEGSVELFKNLLGLVLLLSPAGNLLVAAHALFPLRESDVNVQLGLGAAPRSLPL